jgi:hypothetical protein
MTRFLTDKKFVRVNAFHSLYTAIMSECKAQIRAACSGNEGAPSINAVRIGYANLFEAETINNWIEEEQRRHTSEYQTAQELKKACALVVERVQDDPKELARLEILFKDELAHIREIAAKKRAEAEQKRIDAELKANAPKVTADQQRRILESIRRGEETGISQSITDDDF